jgi:hypothetical protein
MREPVVIIEAIKELVRSGLTAMIAFGVWKMTQEQMGIVLIFVSAALGLVATIFVRSQVFAPTSKDGDKLVAVQYEGQPVEPVKK